MTAQIAETIIYKEKKQALLSCPLDHYFSLANIESPFTGNCTALWRGYTGKWEILSDRLYLISVQAEFDEENKTTLADIFPGFSDRVFAHWYTGKLRIPIGKQVNYVHAGFASTYEKEIFLHLEQGVVVSEEIKVNQ